MKKMIVSIETCTIGKVPSVHVEFQVENMMAVIKTCRVGMLPSVHVNFWVTNDFIIQDVHIWKGTVRTCVK